MVSLIINEQQTSYLINKQGQIYNTKTKKYLKGTVRNGYLMVKLTVGEQKKDYMVHRLVASTFLDNQNKLPQVNHKDRDKLNNCVDNLEWVSSSDNMQHVIKTGRKQRQSILPINEIINEVNGWKQYKNTNYWFCIDGRCANIKTQKFLNCSYLKDGYARYYLYINNKRFAKLAHRLIYEVFVGDIPDNYYINHIDGDKSNNHIDNLELVTFEENVYHAYYILNKKVKKILQYDLNNNLIKEYPSIMQAARELNISDSGICQACKGRIKTYKGFYWRYKEV